MLNLPLNIIRLKIVVPHKHQTLQAISSRIVAGVNLEASEICVIGLSTKHTSQR